MSLVNSPMKKPVGWHTKKDIAGDHILLKGRIADEKKLAVPAS